MTRFKSRPALLAGAFALVLVVFLVVQDQRHGWPFSRHHSPVAAADHAQSHADTLPAGAAAARAAVEVPQRQLEMLGIGFEPVDVRVINNPVHAVATVVADESRITHVHARISGWLEKLYVSTTGQTVRAGQPLAAIYSQELYSSQQEYLSALRRAGEGPASAVLAAARTRLELLGVDEAQIERLERTREAQRLVTIVAPRSGTVLNRGVSAGTSVDPSTEILTLADLSHVWVIAELAESDAAQVHPGATATLGFPMARLEDFPAKVEFIYPTLTERTRTVRVRIPVPNTEGLLRPGMYGSAEFGVAARESLTVNRDAVVDTGDAQHVFVHTAANVIAPRRVKVGARLSNRVEILEGLAPGEHVVTSGVFLIDSESRLRASGSTGHAGHGGQPESSQNGGEGQPRAPPHYH